MIRLLRQLLCVPKGLLIFAAWIWINCALCANQAVSAGGAPVQGLIAHYPLVSDGKDALGPNTPPELKNVEFRPEGFYLNGGYEHRPGNGYRALFPANSLSYTSLGLSVDLLPLVGLRAAATIYL